jgi:hypothetical protein
MKHTIDWKTGMKKAVLPLLVGAFLFWAMLLSGPNLSFSQLYNSSYVVNTTINITNAAPAITAIALDPVVNLNSYSVQQVSCNLSVYDFDNDTLSVVGRLFLDGTVTSGSPDDNNTKYTNSTCSRTTPQDLNMNYTCVFNVWYFANNATSWICNATVSDAGIVPASNLSNFATINPLLAIKLDPLLDYGQLEVGQTSADTLANITNAGNRDANITVKGWGAAEGDGLAFVCDWGTISIDNERYSRVGGTAYTSMTQLTINEAFFPNYFVPQRTDDALESINSTYWKVYIPVGAGGICDGKILFSAYDRGN